MSDELQEIVCPKQELLDYIAAATVGRQVLEVVGIKLETAVGAAHNMAAAEQALIAAMERGIEASL